MSRKVTSWSYGPEVLGLKLTARDLAILRAICWSIRANESCFFSYNRSTFAADLDPVLAVGKADLLDKHLRDLVVRDRHGTHAILDRRGDLQVARRQSRSRRTTA